MVDRCFQCFSVQVGINIKPAKHGKGWGGSLYRHFAVAVATWGRLQDTYHIEIFMEQWWSWLSSWCPPRSAILLTMTSQGWQNALQKSRPVKNGQVLLYHLTGVDLTV